MWRGVAEVATELSLYVRMQAVTQRSVMVVTVMV
jgi:hypothetical protein